ncbi:hypothetical protein [Cyanobium sp. ATX 6F1]|uniref:hypothetical protein n=1 Tax=unclassified Cyanobium TaxID=2627006 RepID=UPI0020CE31C0|nr:hypothetical protein [Cyanobium sp. ATX 6F1]MCP9916933.1 hypothetical protein [Cyanobium sp. ATX 6F1]
MPSDLSTIDLATLNAAQGVIVAAIQNHCCLWEQESTDAAADGQLSKALMLEHWAFAADLLASTVSSEFASLFVQVLDVRFSELSNPCRSVEEQILDALAVEVASAQPAPF